MLGTRTGSSPLAMMADHLRHELTLAALDMAIGRQRPALGLVHHADRGVQYAAHGYRTRLRRHHLRKVGREMPQRRQTTPALPISW